MQRKDGKRYLEYQASLALEYQMKQGKVLTEFCQENTLVIAHTLFQQHKMTLCMDIINGQYRNQIDYILCSQRWRSSIQAAKTRLGADCGSDRELLTATFRLKLKKVEKTTRPFRYNINQIPYDYTVEVMSLLLRELDLVDSVLEELWMEVCNVVQKAVNIPKKKKYKKAK